MAEGRRLGGEHGGIILGWLTRLIVILGLVGFAGFDTVSIASSHVTGSDDANTAAESAASAWADSHQMQSAYDAAAAYADERGETIPPRSFSIDQLGTVHLVLVRQATTLLVHHIGPLQHLTVIRVKGTATQPVQ